MLYKHTHSSCLQQQQHRLTRYVHSFTPKHLFRHRVLRNYVIVYWAVSAVRVRLSAQKGSRCCCCRCAADVVLDSQPRSGLNKPKCVLNTLVCYFEIVLEKHQSVGQGPPPSLQWFTSFPWHCAHIGSYVYTSNIWIRVSIYRKPLLPYKNSVYVGRTLAHPEVQIGRAEIYQHQ